MMYVSGPIELESSSGSICLTRVAGALQAATSGGTITAWINPDAPSGGERAPGGRIAIGFRQWRHHRLSSAESRGNYRRRRGKRGEHHIEADPALHLMMQASGNGSGPLHAVATLNGGGAPLNCELPVEKFAFNSWIRTSLFTIRSSRTNGPAQPKIDGKWI